MKIGIIGAMEVEVASLKSEIENAVVTTATGLEFCEGKIGNADVVIVKSGIGKVNAAICTQILIDKFGVDAILNTGVAGSLNNDINVGDVLLSTDVVHHDVDATVFGYALGEVPQMGVKSFTACEKMRAHALKAIKNSGIEVGVFEGRVASGDQFICTSEKKHFIKDNFNADCCEMEGAAIAHTASVNKVPFLIIRAISDKADETSEITYDVFEAKAAKDCAALVKEYLKEL